MTYAEAVAYLTRLEGMGMKLGLTRTQALLHEVGDPQDLFQGVLVAGTNGKGSVCAILASVLQAAGYRVGLMPKPHLVSYAERIQVDQRPIGDEAFGELIGECLPAIQRVTARVGPPTVFEVLTVAALHCLARAGIDLLVCEVGLGGRLDSTNVLDLGVSVITNIAHDHMQYLGNTLEEIAAEKAAIFKPDSIALTGAQPPALAVIEAKARELEVPLQRVGQEIGATAEDLGWSGLRVTVTTIADTYTDLHVPLIGLHQAENAGLAVAAVDALRARGWDISSGAIRSGVASARWPGRLEVVDRDPIVLLDGAHNPAAMERIIPAVRGLARGRRLVVVFGAMQDKDLHGMLARLRELGAPVIFSAINWHRAAPPAMLAELYPDPSDIAASSTQALARARDLAGADGVVLVCGSLYLVGEIKALMQPVAAGRR